jgi:hypothetical protein
MDPVGNMIAVLVEEALEMSSVVVEDDSGSGGA